jgi:hypothetical protein
MSEQPQILIGGHDRTAALAAPMAEAVAEMERRKDSVFLPSHMSSLRLREARNGPELMSIYADLLRYRHHVDPAVFVLPPARSGRGRVVNLVRRLFWKILRHQHERMFFRQNLINSHLTGLLDIQAREIRDLRNELELLRKGRGSP